MIGICNGFQVLTAHGLLPGALGHNAGGRFVCRGWNVPEPASRCASGRPASARSSARSPTARVATSTPIPPGWPPPARSRCATPVATRTARWPTSPACATPAGVVLGLMPHPENHVVARQHPEATRRRHVARRRRAPRPGPVRAGRSLRQGAMITLPAPFMDVDLDLPDRRDRQGAGVLRLRRRPRCSSPPIACRRSTGSSPACRTRARCSTSSPRGGSPHGRRRRQPRRRPSRPERARRPHRRRRCRSRWSSAATSPVSRPRRSGRSTPAGQRTIYGYQLPDGLRKNTRLPSAIVTPTTKAAARRPRRAVDLRRGRRTGSGRLPSCGSGCRRARSHCSPGARRWPPTPA